MRRTRLGRPADRTELIVSSLRSEIVLGKLQPGYRLPSRTDLERQYGASSITVQRALTRLSSDGFVRVDRTVGTYVSNTPPHLSRYALVFPTAPHSNHPFNRSYATLLSASALLAAQLDIEIAPYYNVSDHVDTPDYIRLVDDINAQRVSGIIFASPPFTLGSTPVLTTPGIPRIFIGSKPADGIPSVSQRANAVVAMALQALVQSGRRRIAVLTAASQDMSPIADLIDRSNLKTQPYWLLKIDLATPSTARQIVHLLMNSKQKERPDALLIDDDNLIEPAIAGLTDAGIDIPDELEVIAHTNLPWAVKTPIPMRNLGVDARQIMKTCLESLNRQRDGERVEQNNFIDPIFESDLVTLQGATN